MNASARGRELLRLAAGFGLLFGCFLAGAKLHDALGLFVPGSVLGLGILLALLGTGVVPLAIVEPAARRLLVLMPLLFVPTYVLCAEDRAFWSRSAWLLLPLFLAIPAMWLFVGLLAERLLGPRR